MNEFHIGKPVNNFLDIFNVQPKPRVVWTMDDDVIDGIAVETSTYSYTQPGLMNVKKRLYFEGKREFHQKVLQFNLTMDLLTEDGDVTVLNLKTGNITLSVMSLFGCSAYKCHNISLNMFLHKFV